MVAKRRAKTDGGTKAHPDRKRVMMREAQVLADRLTAEGFKATVRHTGTVVYAWNQQDEFACSLYWVKGKGWRFDVAQPLILTHADIDFAVDELHRSQAASKAVWEAWNAYRVKKTEKAWQEYQGVLAAHNFRQIAGEQDGSS